EAACSLPTSSSPWTSPPFALPGCCVSHHHFVRPFEAQGLLSESFPTRPHDTGGDLVCAARPCSPSLCRPTASVPARDIETELISPHVSSRAFSVAKRPSRHPWVRAACAEAET